MIDLAAILKHPALARSPRAATLWAALFVQAGGQPGTILIDDRGMAALVGVEPRSLRSTPTTDRRPGSPGAIERLVELRAIEIQGRSVYVARPDDVDKPRPQPRPDTATRPLAGMPDDLTVEPPKPPTSAPRVLSISTGGVRTNSPETRRGGRGESANAVAFADSPTPRPTVAAGESVQSPPAETTEHARYRLMKQGRRDGLSNEQINEQLLIPMGFEPLAVVTPPQTKKPIIIADRLTNQEATFSAWKT